MQYKNLEKWEKRAFDVIFSLGALISWLPILVLIGIIIKITSKGPIIFKQIRLGRDMKPFYIYKFRTMYVDDDLHRSIEKSGPAFKMKNDPRVTGIGKILRKTSIDEMLQFYNVLLGDMSIVGPRPPLPKEVKHYKPWQKHRLTVRPGITCLWQVTPHKNDMPFDDWVNLDLEYIKNWSFKLDIIITLQTIKTMILGLNH